MRAVFLDKDGTLIEDVPYNVDPDRIRFTPGALQGLFLLHTSGYKLFVVSNQSGVARGYFEEDALSGVEQRLRDILDANGIPLAGFYYCPHHPEGTVKAYSYECDCRKPAPGMVLRAAQEHNIDLSRSWLVGDILNDIEAGRRAGCKTVLLDNGHETEWEVTRERMPHHLAGDLAEASLIIVTMGGIATRIRQSFTEGYSEKAEAKNEHKPAALHRHFLPTTSPCDWGSDYR